MLIGWMGTDGTGKRGKGFWVISSEVHIFTYTAGLGHGKPVRKIDQGICPHQGIFGGGVTG